MIPEIHTALYATKLNLQNLPKYHIGQGVFAGAVSDAIDWVTKDVLPENAVVFARTSQVINKDLLIVEERYVFREDLRKMRKA